MGFNWTEIDAVTENVILPGVVDQIFEADPILKQLKDRKKVAGGGKAFQVNLKVDHLNRGKFGKGTTFNIAKKEIVNAVTVPVRAHYVNLTSDGFEEAINSGSEGIVNLLQEKMNDMGDAMHIELLDQLFGDPTVVDPTSEGFHSLQTIVSDKNTYLGLDRTNATYSYWKSVVKEDAVNGIDLTYSVLQDFYRAVSGAGSEGKDIVFATDDITYNQIENILHEKNQITTVTQTQANLGFDSFTLFGKPVYRSDKLTDLAIASGKGVLYALNFKFLEMRTLSGKDFKLTNFKEAQDNDLRAKQLIVMGNFVPTKPSRLGVIKGIKRA